MLQRLSSSRLMGLAQIMNSCRNSCLHRCHSQFLKIPPSSSLHTKNMMSKDPPSKNYAQNPDMNIGLFQALFQPVGLKSRKPRRLRWDWHLRNFLISLIPPGVLWVFLVVVDKTLDPHDNALENTFQGSDEMRDVLKGGIGAFNNARRNETSDAHRGKRSHNEHKPGNLQAYFEQRLEKIEAQLIAMRAERERQIVSDSIVGDRMARVEKARGITKNIVRRPKEAS